MSHTARVRSRTFTECGGGEAETTEQRWSLKVRYKRDAAEQALSLTQQDQSPQTAALLLFLHLYIILVCPHQSFHFFLWPVSYLPICLKMFTSSSCLLLWVSLYCLFSFWIIVIFLCLTPHSSLITRDKHKICGQQCTVKLPNLSLTRKVENFFFKGFVAKDAAKITQLQLVTQLKCHTNIY